MRSIYMGGSFILSCRASLSAVIRQRSITWGSEETVVHKEEMPARSLSYLRRLQHGRRWSTKLLRRQGHSRLPPDSRTSSYLVFLAYADAITGYDMQARSYHCIGMRRHGHSASQLIYHRVRPFVIGQCACEWSNPGTTYGAPSLPFEQLDTRTWR